MVITAACLGRRVCLALQWEDLDFDNLPGRTRRGIGHGEVNEPTTEASEAALPPDPNAAGCPLAGKAGSRCLIRR